MARNVIKEFENSFKAYHKDAPNFLKEERKKLHNASRSKALEKKKLHVAHHEVGRKLYPYTTGTVGKIKLKSPRQETNEEGERRHEREEDSFQKAFKKRFSK